MSNSARIDELRIKFEENSRRYFAPLANEYRKAGELALAIALCREHLPKQPGHMSGYIVFGQALYEAGELNGARFVFEQALDLDPENLIALTHLGNIARDSNDPVTAQRWYGRVLDADPRNDDIAAQLASLANARPATGSFAAVSSDSVTPSTPPAGMPLVGFGVLPTPDSAMRSIDPDRVTRKAVSTTPIDLDAIDGLDQTGDDDVMNNRDSEALAPEEMQPEDAKQDNRVAHAGSPPETVSPRNEADAFDFPIENDEAFATAEGEMGSGEQGDELTPVESDQSEDAFEAGLIAPDWPDTADLVTRVVGPRAYSSGSYTPASIEALADAADAFGRDDADVDVPLHVQPLAKEPDNDPDAVFDVDEELVVEGAMESANERVRESAPVVEESDDAADASLLSDTVEFLVVSKVANDNADDSDAEDTTFADVTRGVADADATDSADFQHDVEEISAAMADDARHAGGDNVVTVAEFNGSTSVEETGDAGDATSADSGAGSSGFVTETMAELLVSQGFVERAVSVYQELARRQPYDPMLTARLDDLTAQLAGQTIAAADFGVFDDHASDAERLHDAEIDEFAAASAMRADPFGDHGTPVYATPYAQRSITQDDAPRQTARERFAALAARRVPRRTPPQAAPAVPSTPEGLASLFGADTSADDDAAARALADAFAPVSVEDLESGEALDFEFARSTPAFSHLVTPSESTPAIPDSAPASPTPHHSPRQANDSFSFDRFFPDPATRPGTPLASPVVPDAPVTDDLAQFSAWLKGLGNS